jgi:hypothetical protein
MFNKMHKMKGINKRSFRRSCRFHDRQYDECIGLDSRGGE